MGIISNVSARIIASLDARFAYDLEYDNAKNPTLPETIGSFRLNLNADSTPPVTKSWSDDRKISDGIIDLRSLPHIDGNIDLDGLKLRAMFITANAENEYSIIIKPYSSEGYDFFNAGMLHVDTKGVMVPPGGFQLISFVDGAPTIGVASRKIAASGDDPFGNDQYSIHLLAG